MTATPDSAIVGFRATKAAASAERRAGVVKWFSRACGYGFIVDRADRRQELFFHHSQVRSGAHPAEGDRVTFEAVDGPRGPAAQDVRFAEAR